MKGKIERRREGGKGEKMRTKKSYSGARTCDLPLYRHRPSPQGRITRTMYHILSITNLHFDDLIMAAHAPQIIPHYPLYGHRWGFDFCQSQKSHPWGTALVSNPYLFSTHGCGATWGSFLPSLPSPSLCSPL